MATPAATFTSNNLPAARISKASLAAYTLPNADTDVMTINVAGCARLFLKIVVGTASLTAFKVKASPSQGVAGVQVAGVSADYTSPAGFVVSAGGSDLTGAATGTYYLLLNCLGVDSFTITAKSGGTATIAIEASAV